MAVIVWRLCLVVLGAALLALLGACSESKTRPSPVHPRSTLSLDGAWSFQLDPANVGVQMGWEGAVTPFDQAATVPGCWQAQGQADRQAYVKKLADLHGLGQADRRLLESSYVLRHDFVGQAWYKRSINVPAEWAGKRVRLKIGGVVRRATVYINGRRIASHEGFSAPFALDVTDALAAGSQNLVAFQVDNTPRSGKPQLPWRAEPQDVTGTFNYIGNWGGIQGHVELEASSADWIDDVHVVPDPDASLARVFITIGGTSSTAPMRVVTSIGEATGTRSPYIVTTRLMGGQTSVTAAVRIPAPRLWSPEMPILYEAAVTLWSTDGPVDTYSVKFGMRKVAAEGSVLAVNNRPYYLRGYGDDSVEVLEGCAPASKQLYLERIGLAKSLGFNAVRFHSRVPPQEFFEAADEAGLFVMAELPVVYAKFLLPFKEDLQVELRRVLLSHRNHPSLFSIAMGNEVDVTAFGEGREREEFLSTVREFYGIAKMLYPAGLALATDGARVEPADFFSLTEEEVLEQGTHGKPVMLHEFGNYHRSLPDLSLRPRFTGVVDPRWLDKWKGWLSTMGLDTNYQVYWEHSISLLNQARKANLERARLMPDVIGYSYWLITDFPGGTPEGAFSWDEGWLNYFWELKGYTPAEAQRVNGPVALLISTPIERRILWADEPLPITLKLSNFAEHDLGDGRLVWRFLRGHDIVAEGARGSVEVPVGALRELAQISTPRLSIAVPETLRLEVTFVMSGKDWTNAWDFWVFPKPGALPNDGSVVTTAASGRLAQLLPPQRQESADALLVTQQFTASTLAHLAAGGNVLLLVDQPHGRWFQPVRFFDGFGRGFGSVVREHPAMGAFPHDGYMDLQFYALVQGGAALSLVGAPGSFEPIVDGINYTSEEWLGFVTQTRVSRGRLLIVTLGLGQGLEEESPAAAYLFQQLVAYSLGSKFNPLRTLSVEDAKRLLA